MLREEGSVRDGEQVWLENYCDVCQSSLFMYPVPCALKTNSQERQFVPLKSKSKPTVEV